MVVKSDTGLMSITRCIHVGVSHSLMKLLYAIISLTLKTKLWLKSSRMVWRIKTNEN